MVRDHLGKVTRVPSTAQVGSIPTASAPIRTNKENGEMKKLFRTIALTIALTFGLSFGGGAAFAAPAHAYTSWYSEVIRCDWVDTYYNVNYNWWEETFQGKRDYRMYIGTKYRYNWACHQTWGF